MEYPQAIGANIVRTPDWRLWVGWALASSILGVGILAILFLLNVTNMVGDVSREFWYVSLPAYGLIAFVSASAQWKALNPYIVELNRAHWIRANIAGYLAMGLLYVLAWSLVIVFTSIYEGMSYFLGPSKGDTVILTITGILLFITGVGAYAIIGSAQWAILRYHVQNVRRLIVSNIVAALIFQFLAMPVGYLLGGQAAIGSFDLWGILAFGWLATLCLSGTITGVTLVRLLQQRAQMT